MSAAHTPGPWKAFISKKTKKVAIEIGSLPAGASPCIVDWPGFYGCDLPFDRQAANARLIAAAPDLLDALQAYSAWADKVICKDAELAAIRVQVRAAIAKATGEAA